MSLTRGLLLTIAALALLALLCHAAMGSGASNGDAMAHAIGDDAASIPDFDGDGTIGFGDFVKFAAKFGLGQGDDGYDAQYDLNGDGEIGFSDFVLLAQNFGKDVPSPVVSIPDANLRTAIESALGKNSGAPITQAEMATLTHLWSNGSGIIDLTGLDFATNLTSLNLSHNNIVDVRPLQNLSNLTFLNLYVNDITDLSPLAGLSNLTYLNLAFNTNITNLSPLARFPNLVFLSLIRTNVSDLSPLVGLKNLEELRLDATYVTDLSPLASFTNLTELWLGSTEFVDISPLAGLTNLMVLRLDFAKITDVSPLANFANLTELDLANTDITDLTPLAGLTNLRVLRLEFTRIADISPLAGLNQLTELDLSGTGIADLHPLANFTNLTRLGLAGTDITDIMPLANLTNLTQLNLGNTDITDITPLASMTNLAELHLHSNNIADISPLSNFTHLTRLNLANNNITDMSPLANFTNLTYLSVAYNNFTVTDMAALAGLIHLVELDLRFNGITEISALSGLTNLERLNLRGNPLSELSISEHVTTLDNIGVEVVFDSFRKGDFDIELIFTGSFEKKHMNMLQYVSRRWMAVIIEELPDYELIEGWSNRCGDHSFEIPAGERIDDLRIFITTFDVDDYPNAVGWGGPSLVREETGLPVVGCMGFDLGRADLEITGLHELGHVLGFGTNIWHDRGFLREFSKDDPNADTHFNGALAITAFDDAGGRDYSGKKVPVQQMDGTHWRIPAINFELMTPYGGGYLSAITVQSLADLGYGVDVTQADHYALRALSGAGVGTTAAKITPDQTSATYPIFDINVPFPGVNQGVDTYGQERIGRRFHSTAGNVGRTGRMESALRMWGADVTFDLTGHRQMWDAGSTAHTAPELTCGAGLMNEPIYVADTQGRIVRTINR